MIHLGATAPRWCLTQALTGTALAARSEDDSRLHGDVGTMDYLKGSVRGRTLRLGKTTLLFDGACGATGFVGMEWHPGLAIVCALQRQGIAGYNPGEPQSALLGVANGQTGKCSMCPNLHAVKSIAPGLRLTEQPAWAPRAPARNTAYRLPWVMVASSLMTTGGIAQHSPWVAPGTPGAWLDWRPPPTPMGDDDKPARPLPQAHPLEHHERQDLHRVYDGGNRDGVATASVRAR